MTVEELLRSSPDSPRLAAPLKALLLLRAGDFDGAHELVQDDSTKDGAWVHALVHRIEGDNGNARYWYRQAGKEPFAGSTDEEWESIAATLCG